MSVITTKFGEAGQGLGEAAGSPNLATAIREIITDMTRMHSAFKTLTALLDSTMTLEGILELLNDMAAKYALHRATASTTHTNADATNVVTAAPATDLASAILLANDLKAQINAHLTMPTTEEEAITLVNDLAVQYEAHRIYDAGGCHNANPDGTNVLTAFQPATNLAEALALANDVKAMYNAHRVLAVTHTNPDNTNPTAAADATTVATLKTLVNELKTDLNAHRVLVAGPVHGGADAVNVVAAPTVGTAAVHQVEDTVDLITAADSTTQATLSTLCTEMVTDYPAHLALATAHATPDTANVLSEAGAVTGFATAADPVDLLSTLG